MYCQCYHRNPDESLREAERAAKRTGDPGDIARWISEKLRAGEIDIDVFARVAQARHPIAILVAGDTPPHWHAIPHVSKNLLEISSAELISHCLIEALQRILPTIHAPHMLARSSILRTIQNLRGQPDEPINTFRLLESWQPGPGATDHILAGIMGRLWRQRETRENITPRFLIDNKRYYELADIFQFVGHLDPQGPLPSVVELGNAVLGIS